MTLEAQAATCVMTGPVRPYSMDTRQAAMEPDSAGMAKGLTKRAPLVLMVSWPSMTCSMPPPEVLMATAARSRCSGLHAAKSRPASATASLAAAMPKWMKRLMRRAILGFMATDGSKPLTSAAMRTSRSEASKCVMGPPPLLPATALAQKVGWSLPMGVTAPRPVTTARRAGSSRFTGRRAPAARLRGS